MENLRQYLKTNFEDFTASDLGLIQYYFQLSKNNEISKEVAKETIIEIIAASNEKVFFQKGGTR